MNVMSVSITLVNITRKVFFLNFLPVLIVLTVANTSSANSFYEDRYNGWIYFDEQVKKLELEKKLEKQIEKDQKKQAFAKARREVEEFAKELEDLRYMMIRHPEDLNHVAAYKRKEAEMFTQASKLDKSYRLINVFVEPSNIDLIKNPINLYGRKIKSELEKEKDEEKNKQLAKKVELFFFFSSSCPYCTQAESILKHFAQMYGYKVEAVSIDGQLSKYFKTHQNKKLIEQLGITQVPTVIAVTNDSSVRFEFIRGAMSMPELEERGVLALEHLDSLKVRMQQEGRR